MGEDSGSDEDFVPSAKKKKRLKHKELSNIQNAQVKTSRTIKLSTKVCKEKDKKKKKAKGVLKKENTKRKDSCPKLTTVEEAGAEETDAEESEVDTAEESEVNTANEAETDAGEAKEKTADETDAGNEAETDADDAEMNTAEKSESINEKEGGGRSYLFSNIFQR